MDGFSTFLENVEILHHAPHHNGSKFRSSIMEMEISFSKHEQKERQGHKDSNPSENVQSVQKLSRSLLLTCLFWFVPVHTVEPVGIYEA